VLKVNTEIFGTRLWSGGKTVPRPSHRNLSQEETESANKRGQPLDGKAGTPSSPKNQRKRPGEEVLGGETAGEKKKAEKRSVECTDGECEARAKKKAGKGSKKFLQSLFGILGKGRPEGEVY